MALTIKAEVSSPDSSGSTTYAVVLVVANACFFLAAFSNTWFAAKEVMAERPFAVRAKLPVRQAEFPPLHPRVTLRSMYLPRSSILCLAHLQRSGWLTCIAAAVSLANNLAAVSPAIS